MRLATVEEIRAALLLMPRSWHQLVERLEERSLAIVGHESGRCLGRRRKARLTFIDCRLGDLPKRLARQVERLLPICRHIRVKPHG